MVNLCMRASPFNASKSMCGAHVFRVLCSVGQEHNVASAANRSGISQFSLSFAYPHKRLGATR